MESPAEVLFNYLRDIIYDPAEAALDVEKLPEDFRDLGHGLQFFAECVVDTKNLALAMSKGDLSTEIPPPDNEVAAPLKALHASLRHLTWQAQQIAQGDYRQRVSFMGDFSAAFNAMAQQLEERRKLDTQEKSKLQQYINLILSNMPSILLAFDAEGKVVLASDSYIKRSKKLSADEIQGKSFAELFSPVSTENFLQSMDALFYEVSVNKGLVTIEQDLDIGQDGALRSYLIRVSPMLHENERDMGTIVVFEDITEIIQSQREAERARILAEQASQAKSDFLARMTHEMRTPMNTIMGMVTIGKKTGDDIRRESCFDNIKEASQHLLSVIDDILDMSNIEADTLELSHGNFSVGEMLDSVKDTIRLQAEKKKQKFTADIADDIPSNIISDRRRLEQVILNILSNAVKFTPEHGSVMLIVKNAAEADGFCKISFTVKDTGIGLSEEQQKYLFTPFEQADGGNSRKYSGTGLGLAISKRIVEMMGGNIWVESELGKGTSFIFEIKAQIGAKTDIDAVPAAIVADIDMDTDTDINSATATEDASTDGIFMGKRILVAEDVEMNREIIATLLENTCVEIDFAFDGVEAVEKFLSAPGAYGMILMDIQMPSMDGYEATKRIRSCGLPEGEKIPIVALSANNLPEHVESSLAVGMNHHLGKPIDIDEVIATLKEYL